jgi:superfamily I DNA and/or RNA helicase
MQYKKQQRELQFQLKRKGYKEVDIAVLTIDQCQGCEADYVILSLVRKPTKFLDRHRFNVALSRVRHMLYLLTDREEFRRASEDSSWDCSSLAKDLLRL